MRWLLLRKLRRDAWAIRGRLAILVAVLVLGSALTVAVLQSSADIELSYNAMYSENHLADLSLNLAGAAPLPTGANLTTLLASRGLDDISSAAGRLEVDASVMVGGSPFRALLVGLPDSSWPNLNDVCLLTGPLWSDQYACTTQAKVAAAPGAPLPDAHDVLVHTTFARDHSLALGGTLTVLLNGTATILTVHGFALSSEFLVSTSNPEFIVPEPGSLAVLWVQESELWSLLRLPAGAANQILIEVTGPDHEAQARADAAAALASPARFTDPNLVSATVLWDQPFYTLTQSDAGAFVDLSPVIALLTGGVTVGTAAVTMNRLVADQRRSIGVLRSLGLRERGVLLHYLTLVLVVGVAGGVAGTFVGTWGADALSEWYRGLLGFPVLVLALDPANLLVGVFGATLAALLGGLGAAYRASRLPIGEAMAPATPRLPGRVPRSGGRRSPLVLRLAVRSLSRRRSRAIFTALGLGLGLVLIISMTDMVASLEEGIDHQFAAHEHWDATATLSGPLPAGPELRAAGNLSWVDGAEPYLVLPAQLHGLGRSVRLVGLVNDSLHSFTALQGSDRLTAPTSVLLSEPAVQLYLQATGITLAPGDGLSILVQGRALNVSVAGVEDEPWGASVYLPLWYLSAWAAPGGGILASGLYLQVRPGTTVNASQFIEAVPGAVNIASKSALLADMHAFMNDFVEFADIFAVLGAVLMIAVVSNTVIVELQEKRAEHGTLLILGAPRRLLVGELAIEGLFLGIASSAVGIALGLLASYAFLGILGVEAGFTVPLYASLPFLLGVVGVALATAQLIPVMAAASLRHIDLGLIAKAFAR